MSEESLRNEKRMQAYKNAILGGEAIYELIPQRPPMVMVDTLIDSDEKTTLTAFTIKNDNLFVRGGIFRESGIIENMAQSGAVRAGYTSIKEKRSIPIGFIGGLKNLSIKKLPKVNDILFTEVNTVYELSDFILIYSRVENKGEIIADCEMKVFLQRDEMP